MDPALKELYLQVERLKAENSELRNENWRMGKRLDGLLELCIGMAKACNFAVTPELFPRLWQIDYSEKPSTASVPSDGSKNTTHGLASPQPSVQKHGAPNSDSSQGGHSGGHRGGDSDMQVCGGVTFAYTKDQDRKGVIYWLGTQKGNTEWRNPHEIGAVNVSGHLVKRGIPNSVVDHRFTDQVYYTEDNSEAWVQIDLKSVMVRPTTYTIAHRGNFNRYYLRSWSLCGSTDGNTWEMICRHDNDTTLNPRRVVASFHLDTDRYYKMFRLAIDPNGNSEGTSALVVTCFEVYGNVIEVE